MCSGRVMYRDSRYSSPRERLLHHRVGVERRVLAERHRDGGELLLGSPVLELVALEHHRVERALRGHPPRRVVDVREDAAAAHRLRPAVLRVHRALGVAVDDRDRVAEPGVDRHRRRHDAVRRVAARAPARVQPEDLADALRRQRAADDEPVDRALREPRVVQRTAQRTRRQLVRVERAGALLSRVALRGQPVVRGVVGLADADDGDGVLQPPQPVTFVEGVHVRLRSRVAEPARARAARHDTRGIHIRSSRPSEHLLRSTRDERRERGGSALSCHLPRATRGRRVAGQRESGGGSNRASSPASGASKMAIHSSRSARRIGALTQGGSAFRASMRRQSSSTGTST